MRVHACTQILESGVTALAMIACVGQSSGETLGQQQAVAQQPALSPRVLLESDRGLHRALRAVVRTPEELMSMWREAHAGLGSPPGVPTVDFAREMVIVAAVGFQGEPGTRITVVSATDREGLLEVAVDVRPAPACGDNWGVVTFPTAMVAVPTSRSTPIFRDRVIRTPC